MCGIVGIFDSLGSSAVQHSDILAMCDAIVHRGPNDSGYYLDNYIGLGMRRLSIIDISGGSQPITNENETIWIVFNGEIYNYLELRNMLVQKGHKFKTNTDTETIIHLYEEYGIKCLDYLRGMFAFIIWDKSKNRVFVARDRLGIKPCFWIQSGSLIGIASEIKSLLKLSWVKQEFDWNGFDAFFTYTFIPAPLTIYKHIKKLPPAHYLLIENENVRVSRYWDLSFTEKHDRTESDLIEEFLSLLKESVKLRLMSEVPLGSFLSGGIDSGLITALMSSSMSSSANTYTINFGGNKGLFLDERPFAREIVSRYNCIHREVEVQPQIDEAIEASVTAFDEPFADDGLIPIYHICNIAKNDVIVVLTGLGGDENFAGYERYLGFWLSRFLEKVPRIFWEFGISPIINSLKENKSGHYQINHLKRFVAGGGLPPGQRYQSYLRTLPPQLRRKLYLPEIAAKIDFDYVENMGSVHFDRLEEGDFLDRALYQDLCMYMPDDILALSDRIGMYHSLELRVPFVDHKLIEFCAKIPSKLKLNSGEKKYLLKRAAGKFLPDSVISHRKQGFCSPMAAWIRHNLKEVIEKELAQEKILNGSLFNQDFVSTVLTSHYNRQQINDKLIFSLLVFQKWHNRKKLH